MASISVRGERRPSEPKRIGVRRPPASHRLLARPSSAARRLTVLLLFGALLALAGRGAMAQNEHHDDLDLNPPPTPAQQAAAGNTTIVVISLVIGGVIYYAMQRHSLLHRDKHPPEWETKVSRSALIFAVASAIVVWGVCSALSRPSVSRPPSTASPPIPKLR